MKMLVLLLLMITGPLQAQVFFNSSPQQYNYSSMTNSEKLKALLANGGVFDPKMGKVETYLNINTVNSELGSIVGDSNKQRFLLEVSYILEELYESNIDFSDAQLKVFYDLNVFVTDQLGKMNRIISDVKETRNKVCDRLGVDRSITDEELDIAVAKKVPTLIADRKLPNEEILILLFDYYEYLRNRIAVLSDGKSYLVYADPFLSQLVTQQDMLYTVISGISVSSASELYVKKRNGKDITTDLQKIRDVPRFRVVR